MKIEWQCLCTLFVGHSFGDIPAMFQNLRPLPQWFDVYQYPFLFESEVAK